MGSLVLVAFFLKSLGVANVLITINTIVQLCLFCCPSFTFSFFLFFGLGGSFTWAVSFIFLLFFFFSFFFFCSFFVLFLFLFFFFFVFFLFFSFLFFPLLYYLQVHITI